MYPRTGKEPRHLQESWRETGDGPSPSTGTEGRDASRGLATATTAWYIRARERERLAHIRVSLEFTARLDGGQTTRAWDLSLATRVTLLHSDEECQLARGPRPTSNDEPMEGPPRGRTKLPAQNPWHVYALRRSSGDGEFSTPRSLDVRTRRSRVDARNAVPDSSGDLRIEWNELRIPRSSHDPVRWATRARGTNVQRTFSRVAFQRALPFFTGEGQRRLPRVGNGR